ncbi:MAG: hypothetical protein AB7P76_00315 [Candidatus Melainabacteria bacterium]
MLAVAAFLGLTAMGCSGEGGMAMGGETKEEGPPPLEITVPQVDQMTRLGRTTADGQYVVIRAVFANVSNKAITISPPELVLQNITDNEKERFSFPPERFLGSDFRYQYGRDKQDRLIEKQDLTVNPQIRAERYVIYQLPLNGDVADYQLYYGPYKVSAPVITPDTEQTDRREYRDFDSR